MYFQKKREKIESCIKWKDHLNRQSNFNVAKKLSSILQNIKRWAHARSKARWAQYTCEARTGIVQCLFFNADNDDDDDNVEYYMYSVSHTEYAGCDMRNKVEVIITHD